MTTEKRILVTGATGKVGRAFIERFLADPRFEAFKVRALCHNRSSTRDRLEVVRGSIQDREVVDAAMAGVTHVLHLATSKETPDTIMDVAVKGMFWLLEACRTSPTFEQFVLIGGDAGMGHFFYPHPVPGDRDAKAHRLPGLLRAVQGARRGDARAVLRSSTASTAAACARPGSWRRTTSSTSCRSATTCSAGPAGAISWAPSRPTSTSRAGAVPVMLDPDGVPVKRNFVARRRSGRRDPARRSTAPRRAQQTFNVCMDEPVDYGELGRIPRRVARPAAGRDVARRTTRPGSTTPRRSSSSAGGPHTT